MKHILKIKPAITPESRHKIEDALKQLGYNVSGGGTATDLSFCDISFDTFPSFDKPQNQDAIDKNS